MKKYQNDALNAADNYCYCQENEPCYASAYKDGYEAGFIAMRRLANEYVKGQIGDQILLLGEEDV